MKKILLLVDTMTFAQKSKKLLILNGIYAEIIKSQGNLSSNGCTFGVRIDYKDYFSAIRILKANEISYTVSGGDIY